MEAYTHFASVYDRLMSDVPYDVWAERIDGYIRKYGVVRGKILEVGCGTGALTGLLYDCGYPITGTDLSEDMLSEAQQKSIEEGRRIPFICMDMRKLTFKPEFETVVGVCDGLNYLRNEDEIGEFLDSARRVLKSKGVLILEWSSPYKLEHIIGDRTIAEAGEEVSFIWENHFNATEQRLDGVLHLFMQCDDDGELFEKRSEHHVQYAHGLESVHGLLQSRGFEVIESLDTETWNAPVDTTERFMIVAKRTD